jgi:hypothetical protein
MTETNKKTLKDYLNMENHLEIITRKIENEFYMVSKEVKKELKQDLGLIKSSFIDEHYDRAYKLTEGIYSTLSDFLGDYRKRDSDFNYETAIIPFRNLRDFVKSYADSSKKK